MNNKKLPLEGFRTYFLYFMAYCVLGWLYEVFLEVVVYRWGFSNRGLLFGPYLPVYGTGALLILACTNPWLHKKIKLGKINLTPVLAFLVIVIVTTVVELIVSYLLEWTIGYWLWDYTSYKIQFQGRICLSASVRFGLGGLIIVYFIQPFLVKLKEALTEKAKLILFFIMFIPFCLDWVHVIFFKK